MLWRRCAGQADAMRAQVATLSSPNRQTMCRAFPPSSRTRAARGSVTVASAQSSDDLYAVLGVERNVDGTHTCSSSKALKAAFRKQALKYHPDVNAAPDAADRFRRIKAAYTTLSDPEQRVEYDRKSQQRGSSSWGRSSQSSSSQSSQRSSSDFDFGGTGKREEFYGFGDFFRDLDKELSDLEKRASSRSSSRSNSTTEKSLLEELAAIGLSIGEELVEFLESGISTPPRSNEDDDGFSSRPTSRSATGNSNSSSSSDARRSNTASSNAASSSSTRSPPPKATPPPPPPKKPEQSVDDILAQLKKDMGLL